MARVEGPKNRLETTHRLMRVAPVLVIAALVESRRRSDRRRNVTQFAQVGIGMQSNGEGIVDHAKRLDRVGLGKEVNNVDVGLSSSPSGHLSRNTTLQGEVARSGAEGRRESLAEGRRAEL